MELWRNQQYIGHTHTHTSLMPTHREKGTREEDEEQEKERKDKKDEGEKEG